MSEIMNVWTELFDAIRRLKASDSPDVWTSYANLVQARAEDFNTLLLALEAENARYKEALELILIDVNEIDRMRTRAEKADAEVERLKAEIKRLREEYVQVYDALSFTDDGIEAIQVIEKLLGRELHIEGGGRESSKCERDGEEHDETIQSRVGEGVRKRSIRGSPKEPEDGAYRNAERTSRPIGAGDTEARDGLDGRVTAAIPAAHPGLVGEWDCRNCLAKTVRNKTDHLESAHRRVRALEAGLGEFREQSRVQHEIFLKERSRAEKAEAELADAKERLETGSRWLKAQIAGRGKAEAEVEGLKALVNTKHKCCQADGAWLPNHERGGFFTCQFCGAELPPEGRKASCCDEMRKVAGGREIGPGPGVAEAEEFARRSAENPAARCSWHHRPYREECPGCLQIRIRTLEAELAAMERRAQVAEGDWQENLREAQEQQARAEKAEAELREHRCVNDKGEYA